MKKEVVHRRKRGKQAGKRRKSETWSDDDEEEEDECIEESESEVDGGDVKVEVREWDLKHGVDIDATESLTNLLGKLKGFAGTEDPSATESIWRLCTKAKAALPSGDRLENLSWRLLHMSLKKKKEKEDAAAAALSASLPADHQAKLEPASPSMSDFFDMNLTDDSQAFFSASAPAFNNNNNNQNRNANRKTVEFSFGGFDPTPSAPTSAIFSKQPIPPPQVNKKSQLSFGSSMNFNNSNETLNELDSRNGSVEQSPLFSSIGFENAFKQPFTFSPSMPQSQMIPTSNNIDMDIDKQFDMLFDIPNTTTNISSTSSQPIPFTDLFNFTANPQMMYSSTAPANTGHPGSLHTMSSASLSSLQYSNTVFSSTDSLAKMYSQTPPTNGNPISPISESPSPSTPRESNHPSPQRTDSYKQLQALQAEHQRQQQALLQQQQAQLLAQHRLLSSSASAALGIPPITGIPPLSSFSNNAQTPNLPPAPVKEQQVCHNCATTTTPMWRRDMQGRSVCNACGVYFRVNGVNRIVKHGGTAVKRRVRVKETGASTAPTSSEMRRVLSVPEMNGNHHQGNALKTILPRRESFVPNVSSSLGRSYEQQPQVQQQAVLGTEGNPHIGSLKRARFDM
ncbi:hypothetical protein HDU79_001776 [Rhizoclosmatium sp. JEL0117]|nr:hypothetical protein HDU79_001776 [Rhizoclosmatium sp. JEL0117]